MLSGRGSIAPFHRRACLKRSRRQPFANHQNMSAKRFRVAFSFAGEKRRVASNKTTPGRVRGGVEKGVVDSRKKDTGKKGMKMSRMMSAELLPKWRERYERRGREGRSGMLDEVCEQFGYSRNRGRRPRATARGGSHRICVSQTGRYGQPERLS